MDNLRILIVEDNPSFALDEEMLVTEMGYELVGVIDNGEEALSKIGSLSPDLILMDIQLKGEVTGLEIARQIKDLDIPIIYTTSFKDLETYSQSKETHSFGYLVKPFDKISLQSAIEQAVRFISQKEKNKQPQSGWEEDILLRDYFMIKNNGVLQKVKISEICYIKGEGNYSTLHTGQKRYVVKMSLRKMLEELDSHQFVPVHKSYLAKLDHIDTIDTSGNKVKIGDETLPLGRNFKSELLDKFKLLK